MKSDYHSLTVSISQAQTLGLEEAALFHCLVECSARAGRAEADASHWCTTPQRDIVNALPFWDASQAWDVAGRLQARGLIECVREKSTQSWKFRFCRVKPPRAAVSGRRPIPQEWQPSAETLSELHRHHGIDEKFALGELGNFRIYSRERGESAWSWDNLFRRWVQRAWQQRLQHSVMHENWRPEQYVLQELLKQGIPAEFSEEALPEFICYWMEKDINSGTWNSKFIKHIKNQWRRYQLELQHDREPRPLMEDWRPSRELYDMLGLANIPFAFAEERLPEFIFYWRERGTAMPAWNALFLRHIKKEWAQQHGLQSGQRSENWQDFVAAHTDPSWRDVG